jgi:hypothetical protein
VAGNTALGKALHTDTMPAFVAAHPTTEYGYAAANAPFATTPATAPTATAKATATRKTT